MPTPADVKAIALTLDGVTEVNHWGRPGYRTKKRIFAVMRPDGLWINVPEERKEFLLEADPKTFVKYMWGKRSNVIVQIDRISKRELEALLREAWEHSKPPPPKAKAQAKTKTPAKRPASRKPATKKR
ncbi:MAG TPA: MmcQ/YjbR family DNA-binding protein [Rhizomicrobium sp.]|nr:MmcQ/YjbR family DNA-binding protein [Rhizomicrobium sp.]